jgi:hypothetical protein
MEFQQMKTKDLLQTMLITKQTNVNLKNQKTVMMITSLIARTNTKRIKVMMEIMIIRFMAGQEQTPIKVVMINKRVVIL